MIGYAMAAGHALAGNIPEAEEVAVGATRALVVLGAALACGPEAAVCGSAAAVGVGLSWDAGESLIANENRGLFAGVDWAIKTGDPGDAFDVGAYVAMEAAGGVMDSKASAKLETKMEGINIYSLFDEEVNTDVGAAVKIGKKAARALIEKGKKAKKNIEKAKKTKVKRSSEVDTFITPKISPRVLKELPGSFSELGRILAEPINATILFQSTMALLFIFKLMKNGQVEAKPFFNEICLGVFSNQEVDRCHRFLQEAINKYDDNIYQTYPEFNSTNGNVLVDSMQTLSFVTNEMLHHTKIGKG